jgi:hypothetical protein
MGSRRFAVHGPPGHRQSCGPTRWATHGLRLRPRGQDPIEVRRFRPSIGDGVGPGAGDGAGGGAGEVGGAGGGCARARRLRRSAARPGASRAGGPCGPAGRSTPARARRRTRRRTRRRAKRRTRKRTPWRLRRRAPMHPISSRAVARSTRPLPRSGSRPAGCTSTAPWPTLAVVARSRSAGRRP